MQSNKYGEVEVESKKSMEENDLLFSCAQDRFKGSQTDIREELIDKGWKLE